MITLFTHPWLAALSIVTVAVLAERALFILAATVAATLHGPYRGQTVTTLDRAGFFVTALVLMCAPVILIGVL